MPPSPEPVMSHGQCTQAQMNTHLLLLLLLLCMLLLSLVLLL